MTIVFVLLTYTTNAPAGIERSIAALVRGLRLLGHRAHVLTAGVAAPTDGPEILRLSAVHLPAPATEQDLIAAITSSPTLTGDVRANLSTVDADLVCWGDASWGLGYLAPHHGSATALMIGVLRTDTFLQQALEHEPDHILTNSAFLLDAAAAAGLDTRRWKTVPNALLSDGAPPSAAARERLRAGGPVRIVARAEPHKGIAELIAACPPDLDRDVEIILATAGFEYWPGMHDEVITECQRHARQHPRVSARAGQLPWDGVQPFLAEAACTVIASTMPETFCITALEALSVATPVVTFDLGHVPALVGTAGAVVPLDCGAAGLWRAAVDLVADADRYRQASTAARERAARYQPEAVATAFLAAISHANAVPGAR